MMKCNSIFFFFFFFGLLSILFVRAANTESATSIQIKENSKNTVTVQSGSLKCSFKYDTNDVLKEKPIQPKIKDGKQIVQEYADQNVCLSVNISPFVYEFCFGRAVTQKVDQDVYSLGNFVGFVDEKDQPVRQYFSDGTPCDAKSFSPRTSIVDFTCSSEPRIISVSEPRVCEYRVVVGIPEACSHPHFSEVDIVGGFFETWFLEISEHSDGTIQCSAYNNGMDKIGSISLTYWSLLLEGGDSYEVKDYDVLYDNRKKLSNNLISVKRNGISKKKNSQPKSLELLAVKYSK